MTKLELLCGICLSSAIFVYAIVFFYSPSSLHVQKQKLFEINCNGVAYLIKYSTDNKMCVRHQFTGDQVLVILDKKDYEKFKDQGKIK